MNQQKKDTIREEFEMFYFGLWGNEKTDAISDWWLQKLDQAYQLGAKDKVEEVRGEIWGEIVKLAEPDEKQFGAGDLNTHLDVIYNIIFKR
jgi:hypothetical protein